MRRQYGYLVRRRRLNTPAFSARTSARRPAWNSAFRAACVPPLARTSTGLPLIVPSRAEYTTQGKMTSLFGLESDRFGQVRRQA